MADPLSILGAVETCLSISKVIWDIAVDIKNQKPELEELVYDFDWITLVLKRYINFFKTYQDRLNEEVRKHLVRRTSGLNVTLDELKRGLKKRSKNSIKDHLLWPLVKSDLEDARDFLTNWVSKLNTILLNLPQDIREPLLESFADADYKGKSNPLSPLVAADAMRKLLEISVNDKEFDQKFPDPRDDALVTYDPTKYFEPDIASVPAHYWNDTDYKHQIHREVRKLVAVLSHAETDKMHILKACKYFATFVGTDETRVAFQYGIMYTKPREVVEVKTLKGLVAGPQEFSLTERIRVATEISSAVAYIHAIGWVHELIRSEHVLLCYDLDSRSFDEGSLGVVKICGFDASREVTGGNVSRGIEDGYWKHELYCHPDRQQKTIRESAGYPAKMTRFRKKHDVYSLGVVLLELGYWKDLETFVKEGTESAPLFELAEPEERKTGLRKTAESLPSKAGDAYAKLVGQCIDVEESGPKVEEVWGRLDALRI